MSRRGWVVAGVVGLVLGAPVAWYLLSPLLYDRSVDEAFPTPAVATSEPTLGSEQAGATDSPGMRLLATGAFYAVAHDGQGTASIYELADGSRVLRFESFEVLNGPDLHVWLVPVDPVPNTVGVEIEGYVELGVLKGTVGDQNYDLPDGIDLANVRSVVVWCLPFRVPFAAAPLRAP